MNVTQADRDAAECLGLSMFDGDLDPDSIKQRWEQAFAAHRLAERARIFWWLRARADDEKPFQLVQGDPPGCALSEAATYIERGDHDR